MGTNRRNVEKGTQRVARGWWLDVHLMRRKQITLKSSLLSGNIKGQYGRLSILCPFRQGDERSTKFFPSFSDTKSLPSQNEQGKEQDLYWIQKKKYCCLQFLLFCKLDKLFKFNKAVSFVHCCIFRKFEVFGCWWKDIYWLRVCIKFDYSNICECILFHVEL